MALDGAPGGELEHAGAVPAATVQRLACDARVDDYLRDVIPAVSGVATQLRDTEERIWGETGVLTCWIDQDYTMNGTSQHISAPTTLILRRESGAWKLVLWHSIPVPEQS